MVPLLVTCSFSGGYMIHNQSPSPFRPSLSDCTPCNSCKSWGLNGRLQAKAAMNHFPLLWSHFNFKKQQISKGKQRKMVKNWWKEQQIQKKKSQESKIRDSHFNKTLPHMISLSVYSPCGPTQGTQRIEMVTVVVLVLATVALAISTVAFAVACFSPRPNEKYPSCQ